jgi:hypothetical protein
VSTGPAPDGAALVEAELVNGLPELERADFEVDFQLADGLGQAIAWTYTGRPKPNRKFLGVELKAPLVLRGVTLIQAGPKDGVLLRWYIDWLDALNRAGLNAALRPVPDGRQTELNALIEQLRSEPQGRADP